MLKFARLAIALFLGLTLQLNGQGSRIFTMDEAVLAVQQETGKSLNPENLGRLHWLPGGTKYAYVSNGNPSKLVITDIETQKTDSSVSLPAMKKSLAAYNKSLKMETFPDFKWVDNDNFIVEVDSQYLNFNVPAMAFRNVLSVPATSEFNEYQYKKNYVAYILNDDIYITTPEGHKRITTDGGKGIVYGQTVHRNEFGISKGFFWSPIGNKLAFYRMDESMVTDYGIYDISRQPAAIYNIKYPISGARSHHVTVGIYDMSSGKVTYLETGGPADQYLTNISWSPEEDFVYVAIVNRGQNQCFVNRYQAETGILDKTLFEERDEKYVEPLNALTFLSNETNKFIWQSEKDGFNHLYLYNTSGKQLSQLTRGTWMVTHLYGVDPRGEYAYFEATKESPVERHIYSVNISTLEIKKLSAEQGTNNASFNTQFTHFLNTLSSTTVPRKITLNDQKGEQIKVLLNAPNPLEEYKLGETRILPIINDGRVLFSRLITPPDYDQKKKYPVIVYVYGGPHAQMVVNNWLGGSNLWMQLMAQKGYIVYTLDNRGSSNRGHEFESSTFRQLGTLEMEDQMAGVNYLKNLPYVDGNRMAVFGWSFGGFMTTSLMTRKPGTFKVGVAGGPVIDWGLYEIMYTERYMDTPQENKEGYDNANLLKYVGSLQDKLLMIHGCDDDVVLWQHSMLYCRAAVKASNTYLDYFVYPGHKHNVKGKDRVHLMQKVSEYIMENL